MTSSVFICVECYFANELSCLLSSQRFAVLFSLLFVHLWNWLIFWLISLVELVFGPFICIGMPAGLIFVSIFDVTFLVASIDILPWILTDSVISVWMSMMNRCSDLTYIPWRKKKLWFLLYLLIFNTKGYWEVLSLTTEPLKKLMFESDRKCFSTPS